MTSARRLLAGGGAALLSLLLVAPPAPAAEEPTVEWTRPRSKGFLQVQEPITGTISTTEDKQTIAKVEFELVAKTAAGDQDPCSAAIPDDQGVQEFSGDNGSESFEVDVGFPCNRSYELKAMVSYKEAVVGIPIVPKTSTATLSFAVAIPPARVTGLAATPYDPATKQVKLDWARLGPEPADFLRYEVRVDPPGAGPDNAQVVPVGSDTSFVYTVADSDQGPHNFRVRAVRDGLDDKGAQQTVPGAYSDNVQAGPEPPAGAPPPADESGLDPSTPGTNNAGPAAKPKTRTTADTGFNKNLPFDPNQTTTVPPTSSSTAAPPPPEDAAVLAIDDNRDQDTRRATVVPVAGGLVLLMGAAHLRLLSKRAEEPEIPIRYR